MSCISKTDCYVLDGGSLLHRLPWKKGDSYNVIAESYADSGSFWFVGSYILTSGIRRCTV